MESNQNESDNSSGSVTESQAEEAEYMARQMAEDLHYCDNYNSDGSGISISDSLKSEDSQTTTDEAAFVNKIIEEVTKSYKKKMIILFEPRKTMNIVHGDGSLMTGVLDEFEIALHASDKTEKDRCHNLRQTIQNKTN